MQIWSLSLIEHLENCALSFFGQFSGLFCRCGDFDCAAKLGVRTCCCHKVWKSKDSHPTPPCLPHNKEHLFFKAHSWLSYIRLSVKPEVPGLQYALLFPRADLSSTDSDAHLSVLWLTQSRVLSSKLSCQCCLSGQKGRRVKPTVACLKFLCSTNLDCLVCFCNNQLDEWQWQKIWLKQEFI